MTQTKSGPEISAHQAAPNAQTTAELTVIILAAGEGVRMKSTKPKVLHSAAGRSLLGHAIAAAKGLGPDRLVVVVRHGRDQVAAEATRLAPDVVIADQDSIPGTGRAVQCALAALDQPSARAAASPEPASANPVPAATDAAGATRRSVADSPVPAAATADAAGLPSRSATANPVPGGEAERLVVICGDTPLLDSATLAALVASHEADSNAATLLSAVLDDPFGYGRIVRDPNGQVERIVEQRDATAEQAAINEINAAAYVFSGPALRSALAELTADNAQQEVYLTDVVAIMRSQDQPVRAVISDDPSVVLGVNDRAQLAQAAAELNRRIVHQAMIDGVTVIDPATTWIDADVQLATDVTLGPGTHLAGSTSVGEGSGIGPFTTLVDTRVGRGATVDRTKATEAVIGDGANVGPFTHLRPGTVLGADTKSGSFTELKAAQIADGAKVPHLAYVGDALVGAGANVGAGTIFANYDGVSKQKCEIGPAVRIGSNNVIVAPVEMGAGAYSGAGTIVRGDVPPGALAVSAGPQRVIEEWTIRKRAGSDSAIAAERALREQGAKDTPTPETLTDN
ncbi:MAG: bifunctional UDP-N-acetylglucosamine diphosphorylase/glucosamine-1-phosphate N-acetyltransferase GlmU [Bifidobacteriaceae bacterium]|jgi:bifunctional UDP-N-acetylglucosamine pyrophosphorylase/glucosamine-1-phosphate N-acetyltransferase|nr:bifunctional UDP-N-acetylglucosamine diphosphorylase/glucosamine-1-phosphate N-acetyltransferase GlmU [Bifidobacteriaceae bacterium]